MAKSKGRDREKEKKSSKKRRREEERRSPSRERRPSSHRKSSGSSSHKKHRSSSSGNREADSKGKGSSSATKDKKKKNKKEKEKESGSRSRSSDKRKERKEDGKQGDAAKIQAEIEISEKDYFARATEFKVWLLQKKKKFFEDLTSTESHELFEKFVKDWNRGKLDPMFYEGRLPEELVARTRKTQHKWGFVNKLSGRDQLQLELANDSVHSSTEKVGGGTDGGVLCGYRRAGKGGRGCFNEISRRGNGSSSGSTNSIDSSVTGEGGREIRDQRLRRGLLERKKVKGVVSNVPVLPTGSVATQEGKGTDRRDSGGGVDDNGRGTGGRRSGGGVTTEMKRQRRKERESHAVVLDEIAPKETGHQAVADKRREVGARTHAAAKAREDAADGLDMKESDTMGGGDSFRDALARTKHGQKRRQMAKTEHLQGLAAKEEEKRAAFMAQMGLKVGQKITIQPRKDG
eukprot:jgi/Undpi1/14037/HiC_scaffold_9.g03688.m1